jgi:periplasmic nitrate reductase NapD
MSPEIHIASCVAYVLPEAAERVRRLIVDTRLAEVPRRDERGRMVILVEGRSTADVLDAIDAVRALDGVLAVHLAYQHIESEAEMQQEHA